MGSEELWVPIVLFVAVAITVILFFYFRLRVAREKQATIREAIIKGQELTPEVLERIGDPPRSAVSDLRRGIVGIGVALGFVAFALILDEKDAVRPLIAIGAFPFILGVAYLGLWRLRGKVS